MTTSRYRRLFAAIAAIALLTAACGGDDDDAADDAAEETEAEDDAGDAVEVTAVDYDYEGLESTVEVGTKISLTNASDVEVHELVAVRLADDEERSVDDIMKLSDEELGAMFSSGPPAMVLVAEPGGAPQLAAVGDGTFSDAGRYLVFCSIPTGADPEEFMAAATAGGEGPPDVEGGPPHYTQGMYAEVTVE